MMGMTKNGVARHWRKAGITPAYPDGGSWQKYCNKRGWETTAKASKRTEASAWWGSKANAEAWLTGYRPRFPEWGTATHPLALNYLGAQRQRKYHRESAPGDPFRLKKIVRCRVYGAIKRVLRGAKPRMRYRTEEMLGCTVEYFKSHIEGLWVDGMSWENYGTEWEIDHTIPLAAFNITDPHHQKMATHYTNQGPMWKSENRHKSDRLLEDVQPELPIPPPIT